MNYQLLKEYNSTEILNPYFVFFQAPESIVYFQYFQNLIKPENIYNILGVKLEIPKKYLSLKDTQNFLNTLTNQNNLLHIDNNTLYFTLFNMLEKEIVNSIVEYITKYRIYIGIYITNKMTAPNELIINTHKQFENCKNKQCLYSILNDCFE
jgi:hypothetical protein